MSSDDTGHVRTELSEDEYERFREIAKELGISEEEAGREALVEWVERRWRPDPNDRAFTVLDELETGSMPDTSNTEACDVADLVEKWHGDEASFELADDPTPQS